MRIGTKLDQTGPKKAICCLKVPFFRSLPGVNGLKIINTRQVKTIIKSFGRSSIITQKRVRQSSKLWGAFLFTCICQSINRSETWISSKHLSMCLELPFLPDRGSKWRMFWRSCRHFYNPLNTWNSKTLTLKHCKNEGKLGSTPSECLLKQLPTLPPKLIRKQIEKILFTPHKWKCKAVSSTAKIFRSKEAPHPRPLRPWQLLQIFH